MYNRTMSALPRIQRIVAVLWPSFLMAGIATILFTTAFDPAEIFVDYDVSRIGFYTITFFLFWLFGAATAIATCYYLKPCDTLNKLGSNNTADQARE